jgi:predicted amidohydrolase
MKKSLNIQLVQTDTVWKNIDQNLENLSGKINSLKEDRDIIVLPELFSTGFTMDAKNIAETMNGKAVLWMKEQAEKNNCLLIGSLLINEKNNFLNRLIVAFPQREMLYYDKRHLFSFAGEDKVFTAGNKKLMFTYKGFNICPLICYDLRFPVWSRNTEQIDLLIYVANWPNARIYAWDTLLKARAIENLCYVVGVNRVGTDNNNLVYSGHSVVFDAMGERILNYKENEQKVKSISLQKDHIIETRNKFKFLDDKDDFIIK